MIIAILMLVAGACIIRLWPSPGGNSAIMITVGWVLVSVALFALWWPLGIPFSIYTIMRSYHIVETW